MRNGISINLRNARKSGKPDWSDDHGPNAYHATRWHEQSPNRAVASRTNTAGTRTGTRPNAVTDAKPDPIATRSFLVSDVDTFRNV